MNINGYVEETRCSRDCSTNTFEIIYLIQLVILFLLVRVETALSPRNFCQVYTRLIPFEVLSWYKHLIQRTKDNAIELVSGRSVINGDTPSSFLNIVNVIVLKQLRGRRKLIQKSE